MMYSGSLGQSFDTGVRRVSTIVPPPLAIDRSPLTYRAIDHGSAADRELILPLLREYFATTDVRDADARYLWLYIQNPAGVARTYVACDDDGRAVGITSIFPRKVRVGERDRIGAIGGDAYVTPRHRRRGIVTRLHRMVQEDFDDRVEFMFGPPEPNNLRALCKAGARIVGGVSRYTRALRSSGLGGAGEKFRWLFGPLEPLLSASAPRVEVEPLDGTIDPRVRFVWLDTVGSAGADSVIPARDPYFYAWRFGATAPGRQHAVIVLERGTPIGLGAIERSGRRAAIVDVTAPTGRFRTVLRALLHACREADAVDLQIHVPCARKEAAVASLGFVQRATKPFQVQGKQELEYRELLVRPYVWHYTWGDGDVNAVLPDVFGA